MSNSQLRTDIPVLPSLPPKLSPANPDAPPSPDTPVASPATPVGQIVETPNLIEQLETGTIEFEIAPGKDGQPEARVLAMADAVAPLDELVVWGKPVDGLQAGFWPASTGEPLNQRVPLDAMVEYHVVVKNTSSDARNVCWQLISFDRGLQCGIRVLDPRASYQTGDTIQAELLYRKLQRQGADHVAASAT